MEAEPWEMRAERNFMGGLSRCGSGYRAHRMATHGTTGERFDATRIKDFSGVRALAFVFFFADIPPAIVTF
jgi:hypothetical protein